MNDIAMNNSEYLGSIIKNLFTLIDCSSSAIGRNVQLCTVFSPYSIACISISIVFHLLYRISDYRTVIGIEQNFISLPDIILTSFVLSGIRTILNTSILLPFLRGVTCRNFQSINRLEQRWQKYGYSQADKFCSICSTSSQINLIGTIKDY
uniref:Uncharacterized protein n=1 Tax=Glossina palpalis gambiensis TaxID=67801 RepID=A0A1B0BTJ2_9MUSC